MKTEEKNAVRDALDNILLRGIHPHHTLLQDLGLDVRYLQRTVDIVKSTITNLSSYGRLRDAISPERDNGRHLRLAETSDLGDVPCLRLSNKREGFDYMTYYDPLLRLVPIEEGTSFDIELFMTWRGEWIVYPLRPSKESQVTVHKTVDELCARLDALAGDTHRYSSSWSYTYTIADKLVQYISESVEQHKQLIEYQEAVLSECKHLKEGFFGK